MAYCFGDINVWSRKVLIYFCWFRIFFGVLIANILWAVADTPISHTTFWKSVETSKEFIHSNIEMTSKELLSTSNNNIDIKPTVVSFDCT